MREWCWEDLQQFGGFLHPQEVLSLYGLQIGGPALGEFLRPSTVPNPPAARNSLPPIDLHAGSEGCSTAAPEPKHQERRPRRDISAEGVRSDGLCCTLPFSLSPSCKERSCTSHRFVSSTTCSTPPAPSASSG